MPVCARSRAAPASDDIRRLPLCNIVDHGSRAALVASCASEQVRRNMVRTEYRATLGARSSAHVASLGFGHRDRRPFAR